MPRGGSLLLVCLAALPGCSLDAAGTAPEPTTLADAATPDDDGSFDPRDSEALVDSDAASTDSAIDDTAAADSATDTTIDSASAETAPLDTGALDTGPLDTGRVDTGVVDTGAADTSVVDASDAAPTVPCTEANSGLFGGHCYFVLASGQSFGDARAACSSRGTAANPTHPATITTVAEHTFVSTLLAGAMIGRWIGLAAESPSNSKGDFKWITGETGAAGKWAPGHPDSSGRCVVQHSPTHGEPNLWEDVSCSSNYYPLCERE